MTMMIIQHQNMGLMIVLIIGVEQWQNLLSNVVVENNSWTTRTITYVFVFVTFKKL